MARTKENNHKKYEAEFKKIREIANSTSVKTLEELAAKMEETIGEKFTVNMLRKRLKLHKVIAKKIQAKLNENKHAHHPNTEDKTKAPPITVKTVPEEPAKPAEPKEKALYTIDASICGCEEAMEFIENAKGVLVITSVSKRELSNLARSIDSNARDAKKILDMYLLSLSFGSNNSPFIEIDIGNGENLDNDGRDDLIIECCKNNGLCLVTGDRMMALKCSNVGVNFKYFKHSTSTKSVVTIYPCIRVKDELYFRDSSSENKKVYVNKSEIKSNMDYTALNKGDVIYTSSKRNDYKTFAVYEIISTALENNSKIIYTKRYQDKKELPEEYQEYAI